MGGSWRTTGRRTSTSPPPSGGAPRFTTCTAAARAGAGEAAAQVRIAANLWRGGLRCPLMRSTGQASQTPHSSGQMSNTPADACSCTPAGSGEAHFELKAVLHPRQLAHQREGDSAPDIHAAVHIVVCDAPAGREEQPPECGAASAAGDQAQADRRDALSMPCRPIHWPWLYTVHVMRPGKHTMQQPLTAT